MAAQVQLADSAVKVSRVVLGCMFPARASAGDVERIVHAAHDAGITSFDTAPLYDFGRGEQRLGRALRDRRQRVQILTKAGLRWQGGSGLGSHRRAQGRAPEHGRVLFSFHDEAGVLRQVRIDSRPDSLAREARASLQRLGTDVVDLLQIHQPDEQTPIAESLGALAALQTEGVIRGFGVSNYSAPQLRLACEAAGPLGLTALQSEYSLLERWPERELLPICRQRGVGFLAYAPLAKGVLAAGSALGGPRALRASRGCRYDAPLARRALRGALITPLQELARARHASCAQVSLAWVLAQPGVSAVVVGASSIAQAQDIARASELTLSEDEVTSLSQAFARVMPWLKLSDRVQHTPLVGRLITRLFDPA